MDNMLNTILDEFEPPPIPPPQKIDPLKKFDTFFEKTVKEVREEAKQQQQQQIVNEKAKDQSFERYLKSIVNVPLSYEIFKKDYERMGIKKTNPPKPRESSIDFNNHF